MGSFVVCFSSFFSRYVHFLFFFFCVCTQLEHKSRNENPASYSFQALEALPMRTLTDFIFPPPRVTFWTRALAICRSWWLVICLLFCVFAISAAYWWRSRIAQQATLVLRGTKFFSHSLSECAPLMPAHYVPAVEYEDESEQVTVKVSCARCGCPEFKSLRESGSRCFLCRAEFSP